MILTCFIRLQFHCSNNVHITNNFALTLLLFEVFMTDVNYDNEIMPKELSWLSFNGRVLQEAADPSVPLIPVQRLLLSFFWNGISVRLQGIPEFLSHHQFLLLPLQAGGVHLHSVHCPGFRLE